MLIVIEGVDQTGKTELAHRLRAELEKSEPARVVHAGPPTRHPLEEYETALADYDPHGEHLILDRWHLGEHVWPRIFNRKSALDIAVARHIELFMRSRGTWLVYAVRDSGKLKRELVEHNEPLLPQDLATALELFDSAVAFSGYPCSVWDYEHCDDDHVHDIIGHAFREAYRAERVWSVTSEWIGSPSPRVLLVGDEFGPLRFGTDPPPVPFAPYLATSGHFLLRVLPESLWRDIAVVNAKVGRTGEVQDLDRIWRLLGRPAVVALGGAADFCLTDAGVPHGTVPHPQYWRRFRHHEAGEYAIQIQRKAAAELCSTPT